MTFRVPTASGTLALEAILLLVNVGIPLSRAESFLSSLWQVVK
jgi:hypothetical protein